MTTADLPPDALTLQLGALVRGERPAFMAEAPFRPSVAAVLQAGPLLRAANYHFAMWQAAAEIGAEKHARWHFADLSRFMRALDALPGWRHPSSED